MKWINVKDKLPKPNIEVLVYLKDKCYNITTLDYFSEHPEGRIGYWTDSDGHKIEVIYWMPLPKPPRKNLKIRM